MMYADNVALPDEGVSFAGIYNPDVMRAKTNWEKNGLVSWAEGVSTIRANEIVSCEDFNVVAYEQLLYGENVSESNALREEMQEEEIERQEAEYKGITMEQFISATNDFSEHSEMPSIIRTQFYNLFDDGEVK